MQEALDRVLVKSIAVRLIHALRMQAKRRKIRIAVPIVALVLI
jgi:hypothetical protein